MKLRRLGLGIIGLFLVVVRVSAMGELDGMHVENAYLTLPPPMMKMTAAYLVIQNHGARDQVLIGVSSPVSGKIEMHETVMTADGMSKMSPLEKLVIPAHGTVELAPGGMHLMVMGLKEGLQTGQVVPLTLIFSDQQQMTIDAVVRDMREQQDDTMSGMHEHHNQ